MRRFLQFLMAWVFGLLAVVVIAGVVVPAVFTLGQLSDPVWSDRLGILLFDPWQAMLIRLGLVSAVPGILLALLVLVAIQRWSRVADGETHCRKCNHILRGLSEPRCSECGEAI